MIRNFTTDFLINLVRKFIVSVLFLASINLFTNCLSPEQYGNYSIIFFLTSIFSLTTSSWLSGTYIRFHFQYKEHLLFFNSLFNYQIIIIVIGLLIYMLLLIVLSSLGIFIFNVKIIFVIIFNCFFLSLFNFLSSFYVANRDLKKLGIASIVHSVLLLSTSYYFLSLIKNEYILFLSSLLAYVFVSIYLFYDIFKMNYRIEIKRMYLVGIFEYGGPLLLISLFSLLMISGDQLIMKFYGLTDGIGIYSANYTLIDKTVTMLTSIFTISYMPILFSYWECGDKLKALKFYKKAIYIYLSIISCLSATIFFLYRYFAEFIINGEYINVNLLVYILGGTLFFNLTNIISEIFTLNKKTLLYAYCFVIPLVLNFTLNFVFLPIVGFMAAAYSTLAAYFFLFISTLYVAKKSFF
jgi:O-antigen/teichoic acid export membrane protein